MRPADNIKIKIKNSTSFSFLVGFELYLVGIGRRLFLFSGEDIELCVCVFARVAAGRFDFLGVAVWVKEATR